MISSFIFTECAKHGTFGAVTKICGSDGKAYALKSSSKTDHASRLAYMRELVVFTSLKEHPHLMMALGAFSWQQHDCYVMPWKDVTLWDYLGGKPARNPHQLFYQLTEGLHHMHASKIMHRDLKPANILMNAEGDKLQIADFGSARKWRKGKTYTLLVCTIWYRAPEMLLGDNKYNMAADIWSLGCVHWELFHGTPAFATKADALQLRAIFKKIGTPPELAHRFPMWRAEGERRSRMLEYKPELRPKSPRECFSPFSSDGCAT